MKISIITVVYNGVETIESAIQSVLSQDYLNLEYIIIDGNSQDGTVQVLDKYKNKISRIISEKDEGIYDAMNKGIQLATGDIIGILNSDDLYMNNTVLSEVANVFQDSSIQGLYADLIYVERDNVSNTIRYWKAGNYTRNNFLWGWMPPHPTVFLKKEIYNNYGLFNTELKSAADYEFVLRIMYRYNISLTYLPKVLIKMRVGGKSNITLENRIKANFEDFKAWKINGLKPFIFTTLLKPILKIKQYWQRPINN